MAISAQNAAAMNGMPPTQAYEFGDLAQHNTPSPVILVRKRVGTPFFFIPAGTKESGQSLLPADVIVHRVSSTGRGQYNKRGRVE